MSVIGKFAAARMLAWVLVLATAAGSVDADVLEDVLNRGTLRVGVALFTPWAIDAGDGKLIGFDVEVARKLSTDMSVKPEIIVVPWGEIVDALDSGRIDVIVAGMAITPERALRVNFSNPYARSGVGLAANRAMTAEVKGLRDLNDPKIVITTVAKTLGSDVAKLMFDRANLQVVADSKAAAQAVIDGKAHAYVASTVETGFLALEHPDTVDLPLGKPLVASVSGLAVKKGEQEMLNFLNAWVAARTADRWLPATQKYWFESLKWRDQVKP